MFRHCPKNTSFIICHIADYFVLLPSEIVPNNLNTIIMYQVFEISAFGGKHSVSKPYPTWLGCKRVRNRIARENRFLSGYRYIVEKIS